MQTTAKYLEIHVPYSMRNMNTEIKLRSGFFDPTTKLWNLPDTEDNRSFALKFDSKPKAKATTEERIQAVAQTSVELLNALRIGQFQLLEVSPKRIVIQEGIPA
jgi:hypothetical protein